MTKVSPTEDRDSQRLILLGTSKNESVEVKEEDLLYIKSNDNYVILYMLNDGCVERKMLRNTLRRIEQVVGDTLVRCHRSY